MSNYRGSTPVGQGMGDYVTYESGWSDKWLDETRIMPTSQHFVQVSFFIKGSGGRRDDISDEGAQGLIKTFLSQKDDQNILILPRTYIENIELDGPCVGARQGQLGIVDPEGAWAKCLELIGDWQTSNPGRINMIIDYGWVGLKPDRSGETTMMGQILSVLLKTNFSLTEDGTLKIDLTFVESTERLLSAIKFNRLDDMILLDFDTNEEIKGMKVHELLEYITSEDTSPGIASQLQSYGIELHFQETYEKRNQSYGRGDSDKIMIRLGDTLADKMNEIISRAIPESFDADPEEDYIESYELIEKVPIQVDDPNDENEVMFGMSIAYGWRRSPKQDSMDSPNSDQRLDAMATGGNRPRPGPALLWKTKSVSSEDKELISFDIDLKALSYASSMMRSELDRKIGQFDSSDWSAIAEAVNQMTENNNDPNNILGMNLTELANHVKQEQDANPARAYEALDYNTGMFGWNVASSRGQRETRDIVNEFNEIIRDSSSNINNQIQSIINNNVFKAKATIMGDPSLGTEYPFFKIFFYADFTSMGEFASFFNGREWQLAKARHKIDENGYTTDLELISLPPSSVN